MSNGYIRVPVELQRLEMYGSWVAVEEQLGEETRASGLTVPAKQAATVGSVLRVGSGVGEDVREGDTVLYEAWQGGRWSLGDVNCLIMGVDNILMVLERKE